MDTTNKIHRNHCPVGGKEDLQTLWTFKDFPVFMGCTDAPESDDIKMDMQWWISASSGLIQLNPLVPLDVLYAASHGSGSVGAAWKQHHEALARFIARFAPSAVLEFGGGHGALSLAYAQTAGQAAGLADAQPTAWTILEPNPSPGEGVTAKYIKGFFDQNFQFDDPFDAIVHSHVFEHFYEPDIFMSHLARFMAPGKHLIFSLPNMRVMMEKKFTNCVNFEHTLFLTEPYIEFLLAKHGFRLLAREYFQEDHSIFYAAQRDDATPKTSLPVDLMGKNAMMYLAYLETHRTLIEHINARLEERHNQRANASATAADGHGGAAEGAVYLFGGHVMSQYLIAFGLDPTRITAVLDNDPKKHGRRLYGTSLQVLSPQVLRGVRNPVVILRAGVFSPEIKRAILENINPDTEFLE